MALELSAAADEGKVLVDMDTICREEHRADRHLVAALRCAGRLHFNDRKYADETDLGSIDRTRSSASSTRF